MKSLLSKFKLVVVGAIVSVMLALSFGTPAMAAGSSYLYRNNGGSIWVTQNLGSSSGALVRNGTGFSMRCWTDGPWTNFYGNYWTNRYFYGTVYSSIGAFGAYVTASDVGNQTSVGHC
jgi:hypothetical protein